MMEQQNAIDLVQLAKTVLLNYEIFPQQVQIIQNKGLKTLWKFSHNGGTMCLKRLRHSEDKALFSVYGQVHIYNNGGNVPRVFFNSDNSAITRHEGQIFVLYGWIDGRDLNFDNSHDLGLAMEGLARVHKASIGYNPPEGARVSSKLGKWPGQYLSMRTKLSEWKELALSKGQQPGYDCYLKHVDGIIEIADSAIEVIQNSPYELMTCMEKHKCPLCHQDYGKGNALLAGQEVYVLDLDGATHDLPARDLRKIIGKQMEDGGGWRQGRIKQIIEWYEKENKLSMEEKEILMIDLLFPHWFFAEVKDLFKKNKPITASKIERAAVFEKSKLDVLQGLSGGRKL